MYLIFGFIKITKMRILLINNEFPPIGGGGSVLDYDIARKLVQKDHKVTLITSSYKNLPREEVIEKFRVIRIPALRKSPNYSTPIELLSFFVSGLFYSLFYTYKFKPDVLQAFFAVPSGGIVYFLNKIFGIPYCIYLGGSDVPWGNKVRFKYLYPFLSPFIKLFWRSADFIIAPSNGLIELAKKSDPKIKNKLIKISNGVDLEKFKIKVKKKTKNIKVLAVGRLIFRKGFQDLIKAISILKKKALLKNFKCIIIGSGDYEKNLKDLTKKSGVEKYITFVGAVNYSTLGDYYVKSDVFVLPSYSEGMSLALVEAMAAKNAVIATNVSGTDEVLENNKNGFLVKVNDPSEIATRLEKLLSNRKLLKDMQEEAYQTAKKYDWNHIALRYNNVYTKMV